MKRLLPLAVLAFAAVAARAEIPFIENDYNRALAEANARNLPLFVETWAPWCHTCRSMRAYVYTDKSLEKYASRFVWLSIDTEDAKNAPFLKRYPIPALPTIVVLDPRHDAVAMRYVGGTTVPQLKKMLDDVESKYRSRALSTAETMLAKADAFASDGNHAEAAKQYDMALAAGSKSWRGFGRAAESLLFELSMNDDNERCASRAIALYPLVKGTVSSANVASTGLSCAAALDKAQTKRGEWITALEKATREVFDDSKIALSGDDRSGLYMALIDARDATGDDEGAIALKAQWAAFLEGAAAAAKTAEQRAVYDSHRLSAYLDLGTPDKAIPMLEQSELDFPNDYNPPARLALAWKALKDYDRALAASDRALAKIEGPRRLTVLGARAEIFAAKGDAKTARETIAAAVAYAKSLPDGQRSDGRIKSLEKKLASME
jgi:tetratricopeptide (TPR) repeat protein